VREEQRLNFGQPFMERERALAEMAANIRYWLKYDTGSRAREGLAVSPDDHIIPPHWPTRRQLELWCHYLEPKDPQ